MKSIEKLITWLPILAFLGVLQLQGQQSSEITFQLFLGQSFRYRVEDRPMDRGDECSVITPKATSKISLEPYNAVEIDPRMSYYAGPKPNKTKECGISVNKFKNEDIGNWTLQIIRSMKVVEVVNFTVRLADSAIPTNEVVPKEPVSIIEGQDLYLRFASADVKNLVECRVNWTNGREVILEPGAVEDPLVEYWGSGLEEDCGVKATKISAQDNGTWILQARNKSGEIIQGEFKVIVNKPTTYDGGEKSIVEQSYETLSLGSADNSKYCLWKSPISEKEEPSAKKCDVTIKSVTKSSEGNWSATFAVPGQLDEIKTSTIVTVTDVETMHANATPSARFKGGLDLLCRWTTYKYASNTANFCRFIRPDGVAFSLEDGIGNEHYSYFGEGINFSKNVKDCGITIRHPSAQDEGTWQCIIGGLLNEIKGSFIKVSLTRAKHEIQFIENATSIEAFTVSGGEKEVLVESGRDVTFGCRATASLNYCWFKHPNGTVLTPSPTTKASRSTSVSYSGLGLALGDCKITVSEASIQDSGEWTCNLGIQGEADVKVSINVRVSDGNIVSKLSQVELKDGDSAELECKTVPAGEALAYCRFVRPDGTSFRFTTDNDEVMSRYSYFGTGLERGTCGVAINPVRAEDFGQWDCYALHAQNSAEGKASINLTDGRALSGGVVAGIVIGCVIAVAAFGGVLVARCQKRRRLSGTSDPLRTSSDL